MATYQSDAEAGEAVHKMFRQMRARLRLEPVADYEKPWDDIAPEERAFFRSFAKEVNKLRIESSPVKVKTQSRRDRPGPIIPDDAKVVSRPRYAVRKAIDESQKPKKKTRRRSD